MGSISRSDLLRPVRRVVIKVGSSVLTGKNGLNMAVIRDLTTTKFIVYGQGQIRV